MWKLQESVILQKTSLNINVDEDNCQPEVKKFNSKTVTVTSVSEPVKAPASTCMLKQAAVANQIAEKIVNQKVCDFIYQKLFIIISNLKRIFMWKTEAVDDFMTVQFFNININITVELFACLYTTSCSKIAAKINECLIQTLLNVESEINMMNCKVAETCDIFIHCEVILEMWTADLKKMLFYDCVENVKVKMTDIISTLFIFIVKEVENELIFKYFWE